MQPLSAMYIRMNGLLSEFMTASGNLYKEIAMLQDKLKYLGISWEGAAHDEYSRVLLGDLMIMEMTAANINLMCRLLLYSLKDYRQTEMLVANTIGGMK